MGPDPWFAKEPKLKFPNNNARSEDLEPKARYKDHWKRGQRCIIPAASFDEPNWESGKNLWWTFRRADGDPWGLAGLWNVWVDKAGGEVRESYTMLTINADKHPLMSRMHRPDPKLAPDKQDKRSVIPIEASVFDLWLEGTVDQARELLRADPLQTFNAAPTAGAEMLSKDGTKAISSEVLAPERRLRLLLRDHIDPCRQ